MANSYTIHVKSVAELAAVVDEILHAEASRIFLVVPDNARITRHILNFKLLRREAEAAHKEVIVVSSNPRVQNLVAKSGLKVHQLTGEFTGIPISEEEVISIPLRSKRVADITASPQTRYQYLEEYDLEDRKTKKQLRKKEVFATVHKIAKTSLLSAVPKDTFIKKLFARKSLKPVLRKTSEDQEISVSSYVTRKRPMFISAFIAGIAIPLRVSFKLISFINIKSAHLVVIILALIAFVSGLFALYLILPSVKVVLNPRTFDIEETLPLVLSANEAQIDLEKNIVPGQIMEETEQHTQQFSATGSKNISEPARGEIRVFNEFSSAPQTLVATTRFVSQDGLIFRTEQTVVIPGAKIENGKIVPSSTFVKAVAAEIGEKYNIGPSTFSIPGFQGSPKFTAFYGRSEGPMTGGFKGVATVVAESDIAEAQTALTSLIRSRAADKLRAKIPTGYFLAPDALTEESPIIVISASAGERKDQFEGTARSTARAVILRSSDIEIILDNKFTEGTAADAATVILPERGLSYVFKSKDYANGRFEVNLVVKQKAGVAVNEEGLRKDLLGKKEGEARSLLARLNGIEKVHIRFWPFWVSKVPSNPEKVTIVVDYGIAKIR